MYVICSGNIIRCYLVARIGVVSGGLLLKGAAASERGPLRQGKKSRALSEYYHAAERYGHMIEPGRFIPQFTIIVAVTFLADDPAQHFLLLY